MPRRFQIDVATGDAVNVEFEDDDERAFDVGDDGEEQVIRDNNSESDRTPTSDGCDPEVVAVLRQIFRPSVQTVDVSDDRASDTSPPSSPGDRGVLREGGGGDSKPHRDGYDGVEPWNYPVSTFDSLGSEDRHYVRAKSKQTGEILERDDHFFASTPFVDCVVQCERSRRLTVRAVDLLATSNHGSAAVTRQPEVATCERAAALVETLNVEFNREKEREAFEVRIVDGLPGMRTRRP